MNARPVSLCLGSWLLAEVAEWQSPMVPPGLAWPSCGTTFSITGAASWRAARRREQQVKWMWACWKTGCADGSPPNPKLMAELPQLEHAVADGTLSPALAVDDIVATLGL